MHKLALLALTVTACSRHDSTAPAAGSGSSAPAPAAPAAPAAAPTPTTPSTPALPPGPPPPPTGGDPCRFATKEEVSAATHVTMQRAEAASPDQCVYFPSASGPDNGLYLRVASSDPYAAMKQTMQRQVAVTGVGDDAFWVAPQLHVKAGAKMMTIAVMDKRWNGGDSQGAATAVARAALPRVTAP